MYNIDKSVGLYCPIEPRQSGTGQFILINTPR